MEGCQMDVHTLNNPSAHPFIHITIRFLHIYYFANYFEIFISLHHFILISLFYHIYALCFVTFISFCILCTVH